MSAAPHKLTTLSRIICGITFLCCGISPIFASTDTQSTQTPNTQYDIPTQLPGANNNHNQTYIAVHSGMNMPQSKDLNTTHTGPVIGVKLGYNLQSNLKMDASFDYLNNRLEYKTPGMSLPNPYQVDQYIVMANAFYNLIDTGSITPYIGSGIGYDFANMDQTHHRQNVAILNPHQGLGHGLTYQLTVGTAYHLSKAIHLNLAYQFMSVRFAKQAANSNAPQQFIGDSLHYLHQNILALQASMALNA